MYTVIVVRTSNDTATSVELAVVRVDYAVALRAAVNQYKMVAGNDCNETILLDLLTRHNRIEFGNTSIFIRLG